MTLRSCIGCNYDWMERTEPQKARFYLVEVDDGVARWCCYACQLMGWRKSFWTNRLELLWPSLKDSQVPCPICLSGYRLSVFDLIEHLNDGHRCSFTVIADILESLEEKGELCLTSTPRPPR